MSLAFAHVSVPARRTTWVPVTRPTARHRAEVVRRPIGSSVTPVTAATLGFALIVTEVLPAATAAEADPLTPVTHSPSTQTGEIWTVPADTRMPALERDSWSTQIDSPKPRTEPASQSHAKHRAHPSSNPLGAAAAAYFALFSHHENSEQKRNAALIYALGKKRGLSDHSITLAVATSIQEADLLNVRGGDRDSLGLFQQRPSVGAWGTAEQILNPTHAINEFYDRLVNISDRDQRPMIDVAIQIQVPDPSAYHSRWHWDRIAAEIVQSVKAS